MKDLRDLKKEFKQLVENISIYLEKLKIELSLNDFEYNDKEIDKVENWFKSISFEEKNEEEIKKMFFSYCSTAFIKSNGGEIILDTNKKSFDYGLPVIVKYGGIGYPWVSCSIWAWMIRLKRGDFRGKLSETILRNLKDKSE